MKRVLIKILVVLLIILILNNFLINSVQAASPLEVVGGIISGIFDTGVINILTLVYRVPMLFIGGIFNRFVTLLAWSEGATDSSYNTSGIVTVYEILFNKVKIIDIDFFDIKPGDTSLVNQFRQNVAAWFYIMRTISVGILLVVFIYVGVRMATSTIASDRAMYKRMLVDWLVSLILVFILQYIAMFVIAVNDAIVDAIDINKDGSTSTLISASMAELHSMGFISWSGIVSLVSAGLYIMLSWQTLGLFFAYFNRMIKIAFLLIIAPLISITYSIDKMGDGKAQALNSWLKEFIYTVLMQPFHCIIYMSLIQAALNILVDKAKLNTNMSETLGAALVTFLCISFIKQAEKIVRKIFAFADNNSKTSLVAGVAIASTVLNKAKSFGQGTANVANGVISFGKNVKGSMGLANVMAESKAAFKVMTGESDNFKETVHAEKKEIYKKRTDKITKGKGIEEYYGETLNTQLADIKKQTEKIGGETKSFEKDLETEKQRITNNMNNKGVTLPDSELEALAKYNLAKKARTEKTPWRRSIKGATSGVKQFGKDVSSGVSKVFKTVDGKIPFQETRKLIAKGILPNSLSMFMGTGYYGLNGDALGAITTAFATKSLYKGVSENSASNVRDKNQKLLDAYTFEDSDNNNENSKKKKEELLSNISQNSENYSDEELANFVESQLSELESLLNINLKNKKEVENASSTIASVLGQGYTEPEDLEKNLLRALNSYTKSNATLSQLQNNDAFINLRNKGIEASISRNIASAQEKGISLDRIVRNNPSNVGNKILRENRQNINITETFMNDDEISEETITQVAEMSDTQLEDLDRRLDEQINSLLNVYDYTLSSTYLDEAGRKSVEDGRKKIEERVENLKAKRDLLLSEAIQEAQGELSESRKNIVKRIIAEKKARIIPNGLSDEDTERLDTVIEELEKRISS